MILRCGNTLLRHPHKVLRDYSFRTWTPVEVAFAQTKDDFVHLHHFSTNNAALQNALAVLIHSWRVLHSTAGHPRWSGVRKQGSRLRDLEIGAQKQTQPTLAVFLRLAYLYMSSGKGLGGANLTNGAVQFAVSEGGAKVIS